MLDKAKGVKMILVGFRSLKGARSLMWERS